MTRSIRYLLACASLWGCVQAQAQEIREGCWWVDSRPEGPWTYTSRLGTRYIARDAPIGTPIILRERRTEGLGGVGPVMFCYKHYPHLSPLTFRFDMLNVSPLFGGDLPPVGGMPMTGKVIETSIPGVGVHVRFYDPFRGISSNEFKPVGGEAIVPFVGTLDHWSEGYVQFHSMYIELTLVKTGPIPPGAHHFDTRRLIAGSVSDLGPVFDWMLEGQIVQNQCSLPLNPVSADPVQLGSWDRREFTGAGFTTPAVPFHITLSDCEDNPANNVTVAHIRLDGVQGSTPVDAERGVFSLTGDSSAAGLGIQMLMADGITPLALGRDVPLKVIAPSGDTVLPFSARYYQTGTAADVRPGSAKGALSFTIRYQ